ncbi:Autophagy-related protein 16 [Macrophomina phaseolina MS6]|uniref:Autophagy-related protein 16 n=1 Tax=Macrophomina phaseolina (strain MS6) TaxID=1126212 RepID=K2S673_MACPH|nr:Autophagy-related protein 16 [Macrophomina phaseolina MS6]
MTSSAWLSDYTTALQARDQREKAQEAHINAYTKLADRTARLEAERAAAPPSSAHPPPTTAASPQPAAANKPSPSRGRFGRSSPAAAPEPETPSNDVLARLRADLAQSTTSRAALQAQLSSVTAELAALKTRAARDEKAVADLKRQAATLERKLRDRESEVKGKTRLVEEVQDELVSVNLQLNMAEQKSEELERENRELVDRWMKYKREEAERMNDLSKWE